MDQASSRGAVTRPGLPSPHATESLDSSRPFDRWLLVPVLFGSLLFAPFLVGSRLFLGNFDRLSSSLNILWLQTEALRHHVPYGWTSSLFMGVNLWALPWAPPNPEALLLALLPVRLFLPGTTVLSFALFLAAGVSAYFFVRSVTSRGPIAAVAALLYQFSYASVLRISQHDLTYLVLVAMPLGMLAVRSLFRGQRGAPSFCCTTLTFLVLTVFGFLQEVAYACILLGAYALFLGVQTRRIRRMLAFALAAALGIGGGIPRLVAVGQELPLVTRHDSAHALETFEELYAFQNITAREVWRALHAGIFGRSQVEASEYQNNINLSEGIQVHASSLGILVFVAGSTCAFCRKRRTGTDDRLAEIRFFSLWALAVLGFAAIEPMQRILYQLFLKQDFTHSRLGITALLPMAAVSAWALSEADPLRCIRRSWVLAVFLGLASSLLVAAVSDRAVPEIGPMFFVALQAYMGPTPATLAETWAVPAVEVQILAAGLVFVVLCSLWIVAVWMGSSRRSLCVAAALGFIAGESLAGAGYFFHGEHAMTDVPFHAGDPYLPKSGAFRLPDESEIQGLRSDIGDPEYATAFVKRGSSTPFFVASYLGPIYGVRTVDGYSAGVPVNLVDLEWPPGVVSLRTITFEEADIPWRQLALLNVDKVVAVDGAFYKGERKAGSPSAGEILKNPYQAWRRAYWASAVGVVPDRKQLVEGVLSNVKARGSEEHRAMAFLAAAAAGDEARPDDALISVSGSGAEMLATFAPRDYWRFLVINERFHPGWNAASDVGDVAVVEANACMRGVAVPPLASLVRFRFEPLPPWLYAACPSAVVFALGALLIVSRQRGVRADA